MRPRGHSRQRNGEGCPGPVEVGGRGHAIAMRGEWLSGSMDLDPGSRLVVNQMFTLRPMQTNRNLSNTPLESALHLDNNKKDNNIPTKLNLMMITTANEDAPIVFSSRRRYRSTLKWSSARFTRPDNAYVPQIE